MRKPTGSCRQRSQRSTLRLPDVGASQDLLSSRGRAEAAHGVRDRDDPAPPSRRAWPRRRGPGRRVVRAPPAGLALARRRVGALRRPARTTTKYTRLQHAKESFCEGVSAVDEPRYDAALSDEARALLACALPPLRFALHGIQQIAAYVGQMAPEGRVTIAALLQGADELRRIQRIAYRMAQLRRLDPTLGDDSRARFEREDAWQPLRRALEALLVTWDWAEAFVALNLCLKPVVDELFMVDLPALAKAAETSCWGSSAPRSTRTASGSASGRPRSRASRSPRPTTAPRLSAGSASGPPRASQALEGLAPMLERVAGGAARRRGHAAARCSCSGSSSSRRAETNREPGGARGARPHGDRRRRLRVRSRPRLHALEPGHGAHVRARGRRRRGKARARLARVAVRRRGRCPAAPRARGRGRQPRGLPLRTRSQRGERGHVRGALFALAPRRRRRRGRRRRAA